GAGGDRGGGSGAGRGAPDRGRGRARDGEDPHAGRAPLRRDRNGSARGVERGGTERSPATRQEWGGVDPRAAGDDSAARRDADEERRGRRPRPFGHTAPEGLADPPP